MLCKHIYPCPILGYQTVLRPIVLFYKNIYFILLYPPLSKYCYEGVILRLKPGNNHNAGYEHQYRSYTTHSASPIYVALYTSSLRRATYASKSMCSKAPWPVAPAALQLGLLTPLVKPDGVEPHLSNGLARLRQPHTDPAPHRPSPTSHQKKNSPKVFVNTKNIVVVAVDGYRQAVLQINRFGKCCSMIRSSSNMFWTMHC